MEKLAGMDFVALVQLLIFDICYVIVQRPSRVDSLWPLGLQSVYAIHDLFAKCALSMPIINSYRKVIIKSERLKGGFFYERERYPLRPAIYSL